MDLPKRKQIRLPDYDYSAPGAYFVTVCTHEKRCILSTITIGAIHALFPDLTVWQRSYHEHVIRGENDYRIIWEYIENNPARWTEDRYFTA